MYCVLPTVCTAYCVYCTLCAVYCALCTVCCLLRTHQVVLNATTLGRVLLDVTHAEYTGKYRRKFNAALKALGDFDHLRNWLWEQVRKLAS